MEHSVERKRLLAYHERKANWKNWGPYLSERAWGTVREDYSAYGTAWDYLPHDHARSRTYRWNEDGLAGISDRFQYLCFALALWNGRDPILKERLFGLNGHEGNHGEDVKEQYFYLDNIPTHCYMKMLYKYPQRAYPYAELVAENGRRGFEDFEYELLDSGIFEENRYFDVLVEYAKAGENDMLVRISATNRAAEPAPITLLPTLWYRNTWSWGYPTGPMGDVTGKPNIKRLSNTVIEATHTSQGKYFLFADDPGGFLFTENETNNERLFGVANASPFVKDAFHRYLIQDEKGAVNPDQEGTKTAVIYHNTVQPDETYTVRLRLADGDHAQPFSDFEAIFAERLAEADAFYGELQGESLTQEEKNVQRQALAGMLWTKQMYYFDVNQWLDGDPGTPPPPDNRRQGRNHNWDHLNNFDIISMPDKWEYPWYAAWDLAFHCLPLTLVDADFAKRQLELMGRVWYMHPNGQFPAYEWAFGDVNPPVHAWATWQVYCMDGALNGRLDRTFLEGIYHKLALNFTWWVNRKDADDRNIFQGGFLGLDNISLFDRSASLPTGGHIDQSDGTSWMGFYSLGMMKIALELARENPVYQNLATKFYEHFLRIAHAMTNVGGKGFCLWDEEDGFFYDVLHLPDESILHLRVRSLVGLIPLLAVETLEPELLQAMPDFTRRMHWFTDKRPDLSGNMASIDVPGTGKRIITSILTPERLVRVLYYMLDEEEFLSPFGIRSISKYHEQHPYILHIGSETFSIHYEPTESRGGLFGGNSNWRGPIWFPINYLIIESLREFHSYYGDQLKVECPTGSGTMMTLEEVAQELSRRLVQLFLPDDEGRRPVYGGLTQFHEDPLWRDYILFYEYFNGDNGAGLGASHQTGWTGLVANLLQTTLERPH
jgi:hypothetical protein